MIAMHERLGILAAMVGAVALSSPAYADPIQEAEKARLQLEMKRYAERGAWAGVTRSYNKLVALTDVVLSPDDHLLGFEAARKVGDTAAALERLRAASALESRDDVELEISNITSFYGPVKIVGHPRRRPLFTRPSPPFDTNQKASVAFAKERVEASGSFEGWLPMGAYAVGDVSFTVEAAAEQLVVNVKKAKSAAPSTAVAATDGPETDGPGPKMDVTSGSTGAVGAGYQEADGAVLYWGPVALLGPSGGYFPEPGPGTSGSFGPEGSVAPSSLVGAGLDLKAGVELGFTRLFAVAGGVGFTGSWSAEDFGNRGAVWADAVLRPGDLRITLGGLFGVTQESATGIASWIPRTDDADPRSSDSVAYRGVSYGPGVSAGIGYGIFPVSNGLQASIGATGAWQAGPRSQVTFGLHLGIVPTVPRFK